MTRDERWVVTVCAVVALVLLVLLALLPGGAPEPGFPASTRIGRAIWHERSTTR